MSKVRHFVDNLILVMLYYSLIYPFLTYGVHVWSLTFSSFLTQLFNYLLPRKKQSESRYLSPNQNLILSLCSNLSIYLSSMTSLNHRYSLFVYRWTCRLLSPCFSEYFKFISSVHSYSTRQSCNRNLYVALANTTRYGLRSLKCTGLCLWNSLLTSITNSNSLRIFHKTLIKNSILSCYSN